MTHRIVVEDQSLRWYGRPPKIADDSIEFVQLQFHLPEEWASLLLVAQFTQADTYNMLMDGDKCFLPKEITAGLCKLSLFGYAEGKPLRATSIPLVFQIEESGFVSSAETPIPPTPDLYAQLIEYFSSIAGSGGGGSGSGTINPEDIAAAVEDYLSKNPPEIPDLSDEVTRAETAASEAETASRNASESANSAGGYASSARDAASSAVSAANVADKAASEAVSAAKRAEEAADSIADSAEDIERLNDFAEPLGFARNIVVAKTEDMVHGTWANGTWRTDGNYGRYFRSTSVLVPLRDYEIKITASTTENMILNWSAFGAGGQYIGATVGGFGFTPIPSGLFTISASDVLQHYPSATQLSIAVGSYNGSAFVDFPTDTTIKIYYIRKDYPDITDRVYTLEQTMQPIRQSFINYLYPKNGKNTINLIGDSISQGVFSDDVSRDSYVGILRHMIQKDLGGCLNYGFIPFNIQNGFSSSNQWWNYAPLNIGDRGNAVFKYDGRCYGIQGYKLVDDTDFRFKVNMYDFSRFRITYLKGYDAVLQIKKRKNGIDTVLGMIDCNGTSVEGAYSQVFDMGDSNDSKINIYINMISGTEAHISGIEIIQNDDYQTFNNYALAGASTGIQDDATIAKEANDCDFLIWALGYNDRYDVDAFRNNIARYIPIIKTANCEVIIIDFQWDSANGCKDVLRDMARQLDCLYLDMLELAPKKADGSIIPGFLNSDGTHPDELGHRYIAECIAKRIGLRCVTKPDAIM